MTRPTRAAALYTLGQWQQAIQHANELMAPAVNAMLLPPESPPWVAVQQLQQSLTTVCAALVCDDTHNWLEWYWLENAMGAKAMPAASNGNEPRPIQSLEDLAWLLGYPEDEPK